MKIFIFIEWALFHSQSLCYVINIYIQLQWIHNNDQSIFKFKNQTYWQVKFITTFGLNATVIFNYLWPDKEGRKEMFYLTTHSTHFIYGYMASDIWLRTILIVRKETRCRHIGYSFWLAARVLLYAPSHRQDSTYHGLYYTSRGALAGMRNSSMGPPWRIDLTTHRTMSERSYHGATSRSLPDMVTLCQSTPYDDHGVKTDISK